MPVYLILCAIIVIILYVFIFFYYYYIYIVLLLLYQEPCRYFKDFIILSYVFGFIKYINHLKVFKKI